MHVQCNFQLSKEIAELQSEIVYSPEEYQSRLDELKEQYKLKLEDRDIIQEAIQEKKQSIKQIEEKLNFVPRMNDMFSTLIDIYKELMYVFNYIQIVHINNY